MSVDDKYNEMRFDDYVDVDVDDDIKFSVN